MRKAAALSTSETRLKQESQNDRKCNQQGAKKSPLRFEDVVN